MTDLPYRRCVGIMLVNADGRVFVGRRKGGDVEPRARAYEWQMPQGGIDRGEEPLAAAKRELYEETGVSSVELIAESPAWYAYDFPPEVLARTRSGRYRGQTQRWFAFRFTGPDAEIDVASPGGHKAEFSDWRWADIAELPELIVPFKRGVYDEVLKAFAPVVKAADA
ncbi:putative (di)nucleoside polyphosphate hydrolase [Methylopila capsulata]|uniref:RNA pyrophosphohydrolase n=1 Tax=Methylopila capsulata TaxID=61654 RepID=A0A9W6IQA9_9HYPH|nr:RNA pyrophosphohydrolase [Methylopila capsulata]MBM7851176.1 putative (di)nucleoside polyphosphate hydrolase [Methylopila capsulata]GLK54233.1 RNA pyrophosphohydrolase [Methylopila capsulata]